MPEPITDVSVITGASGGIGRWISEAASTLSRVTVLIGRDRRRLAAVAARCSGEVRMVIADLSTASQLDPVHELVDEMAPARIAVIVAAGVIGPIALPGMEDASEWESALETNVIGTYRAVHPFLSTMRDNDWGRVVVLSSAQTLHGPDPLITSYATAKLAVNAYTACLAAHFEGTGVSACAIHPGDAYTSMSVEIRQKAEAAGAPAAHLSQWASQVAAGDGDDPRQAGELVAEILIRPASWSNGRFLLVPSSIERHPDSGWAMSVGPRH